MKNLISYGFALCLILSTFVAWSFENKATQEPYYSIRTRTIILTSDTFCMDSIRFLPSSLIVKMGDSILLKNKDYRFDSLRPCIVFDSSFLNKEISLIGRVFDANKIDFRTYKKNPLIIEPEYNTNPYIYTTTEAQGGADDFIKESGLNIMGNISRGVGVGNTQDLILSSDLNLQITGKLGDQINVIAAISDQNNPIQPEGNTQQIQDFDQVYISFFKDSTKLTVGDFLMEGTRGDYFKKFYKKSRGFQFEHRQDSFLGGINYSKAELAVSRGKFARNEIQGEEGNQGPYRLTGTNGEIFIMIIAGTEAVYVDGKLLERGQQNDYVIDYNTGEIIFMPRILINQFSRIVIEFQFADRNYARSVLNAANVYERGKIRLRGGFFSEQDNRNQPFQQSLDLFDSTTNRSARDVLTEAGDNPMLAAIPNITRFRTFQQDRIMYRQIDTLGTTIYQYTDNPNEDTVFYAVTFTRVGEGNGNYRQKVSLANGRVFEYLQPLGGILQGDYEPVVRLIAPERLQMFTAGLDWKADSNTLISVELASSNEDKNRFSTMDAQDNAGFAASLNIERADKFKVKNRNVVWNNKLSMEWADQNFKYVERYRDVEFERSWNRQYRNPSAQRPDLEERILNFGGNLGWEESILLNYKFAHYERGNEFSGSQGGGGFSGKYKGFSFSQDVLIIQTQFKKTSMLGNNYVQNNNALDLRGNIQQKVSKNATVALDYISEESIFNIDTTENIELNSYRYNQVGLSYHHKINETFSSSLNANRRIDYQAKGEQMQANLASNNINLNLEKEGKKWKDRLIFTLSYRDLEQLDTIIEDLPEQTILSRLEYQVDFFKRVIISNTYYQIGTGREQRREFTYIEVPAGRGTHTWNDYNDNGIREINEFEPALFNDQANFIKVMIPTNEFIRSNTNEFNQTLKITPPIKWQTAKGIKKLVSRFSTVSSYRADRRMTDNNLSTVLNPFELGIADTSLINLSSLVKSTVFFNRSNPKFGAEYNFQRNGLKQFLIQGFDGRFVQKNSGSFRINFNSEWSIVTQGELGIREFTSDFAPNRNFAFDFNEVHPTLFWQPGNAFRVGGFYKYYEAFNKAQFGGEKAYWSEVGSEFRAFLKNLTTIDGKISFVNINFTGDSFSPVAWDMLKGLQNGRNFSWSLLVGGKIGKNIQLTINYEGRNNESAPTIHIGRAEARYLF